MVTSITNITINCGGYCDKVLRLFHECQSVICTPSSYKANLPPPRRPSRDNSALRDEIIYLSTASAPNETMEISKITDTAAFNHSDNTDFEICHCVMIFYKYDFVVFTFPVDQKI